MRAEMLGTDPSHPADRALLDAVRPRAWRNPEPPARYHLVVIGAGTAGLVTAAAAAGLGARVALVERHLMGGDCLNVGCVPSKALIAAARAWRDARSAGTSFGAPRVDSAGDGRRPFDHLRTVRSAIAMHDSAERFRSLNVDVYFGDARFVSRNTIAVHDVPLRFRRAVIATGTRPTIPPITGLEEAGYLTNETIFSLAEPPARLAVLGGGAIGCELAQAFARLGTAVTVIESATRILGNEDPAAAAVVADALEQDGVRVLTRARVERVALEGGMRVLTAVRDGASEEVAADALLVATGRTPNVERLALDAAGVEAGREGVRVDDRLRTTNRRVYAAGDVTGTLRFTHVADAHARIVVANALFFARQRRSSLVVPRVTYTDPELAHVGLTAAEADERGVRAEEVTIPLDSVDRARLESATDGFLTIRVTGRKGRIVGATLVGRDAGELIPEITVAMQHRVGLGRLSGTIHPYPTRAEVVRKAADSWRRGKLTPGVRRLLRYWFALFR